MIGQEIASSPRCPEAPQAELSALLCLALAWSTLLAAGLAAPLLGRDVALLGAFTLVMLGLAASRPRRPWLRSRASFLLAALAGYALLPWLVLGVQILGVALGLEPGRAFAPGEGGPVRWLSVGLLAPVFEELLFRERLLEGLLPRLGALGTLLATSVLFSVGHVEPWLVLGALPVGLVLGTLALASRDVGVCIGFHLGLNGAAIACGVPPLRWVAPPLAAVASLGLLALVLLRARRGDAGSMA